VLLLISSNASRRYGDDIVRALAHPHGADFQFRYGLKYFDPSLLTRVNAGSLAGETALICFLHTDKTARTATFVSCRVVKLLRSEVLGSSCILTLAAGDYVHPLTDSELRAKLTPQEQALLPAWGTNPDFPSGKFVIEVDATIHSGRAPAAGQELKAFEETAAALSAFTFFDASSRLTFYAVRTIASDSVRAWNNWSPTGRTQAAYKGGKFDLVSGRRYDLEVYTFSPVGGSAAGGITKLQVESDEKAVRFVSAKEVALDSRYDLNRFTFTTDQLLDTLSAGLRLALMIPTTADPKSEQRCDVTFAVSFRGRRALGLFRMLIIAIGTAAPAIIGIAYKDEMNIYIGGVMFVSALIAGWGAVFLGAKKS
jgi:hypothetical protein